MVKYIRNKKGTVTHLEVVIGAKKYRFTPNEWRNSRIRANKAKKKRKKRK